MLFRFRSYQYWNSHFRPVTRLPHHPMPHLCVHWAYLLSFRRELRKFEAFRFSSLSSCRHLDCGYSDGWNTANNSNILLQILLSCMIQKYLREKLIAESYIEVKNVVITPKFSFCPRFYKLPRFFVYMADIGHTPKRHEGHNDHSTSNLNFSSSLEYIPQHQLHHFNLLPISTLSLVRFYSATRLQ